MSIELKRFAILGLHGRFDIDIPITDNKLILIGVNGLGKTTVVNLIYFLLTTQWERLLDYEFIAIELELNGSSIRINREDIQSKLKLSERYEKVIARWAGRLPIPSRLLKGVFTHPLFQASLNMTSSARERAIIEISRDAGLPSHYISRILADMPPLVHEELLASNKDTAAIVEFLGVLKDIGNHQVIYLPTYRRIEQDLKSIFPSLDEEELQKITMKSERMLSHRNRGHVELIQFGMKDVESKIADELQTIREQTRSQLTNLTASYLKDIISNHADAIPNGFFQKLDDKVVASVLQRVEENTLSAKDKLEIELAIKRVRDDESAHEVRDKYLAYFFARLLDIYINLSESEENIRRLVDTCNRYFERKQVRYDDNSFTADVVGGDETILPWTVLSSGEKQVASLFTHLFLSRNKEQTVIIDEPELSLSVLWQKSLLPDIVNSDNCKLLIAVTHSPFIYANEMDAYAVDLSKCISASPPGQPD